MQIAHGDLKAYSTDQIGPQVTITGVATFGTFSSSPTQAREHAVPGGQQPVAPRRRACAARWRRFSLQRRHDHVPAHLPRQLHVLVAGQLPDRQLQRIRADVRRSGREPEEPERRRLRAGRVARQLAADAQRRPSLRSAVPRDDQHRHQQRVAAGGLRLGADGVAGLPRARRRGRLLRSGAAARRGECALVSGEHDGRHAAAPAAGVRHSADAGRRSGVSQYPARPSAVDGPRVDHDDGQGPAERVLEAGEHRGRANARRQPNDQRRLSVFPRREPADVDQPERARRAWRRARTTGAGRCRPT